MGFANGYFVDTHTKSVCSITTNYSGVPNKRTYMLIVLRKKKPIIIIIFT